MLVYYPTFWVMTKEPAKMFGKQTKPENWKPNCNSRRPKYMNGNTIEYYCSTCTVVDLRGYLLRVTPPASICSTTTAALGIINSRTMALQGHHI